MDKNTAKSTSNGTSPSRCFANPWIESPSSFPVETALTLYRKCEEYYSNLDSAKGTIYTGMLGFVYLSYKLSLHVSTKTTYKIELLEKSRNVALDHLVHASDRHDAKLVTLLEGIKVGALALSSAINHELGDSIRAAQYAEELLNVGRASILTKNFPSSECEVLYGKSGYLQSILFLRKALDKSTYGKDIVPLILQSILLEGKKTAEMHGKPNGLELMWQWHGKVYLGAAHGIAGILHVLLCFIQEIEELLQDGKRYIRMMERTIKALNESCCQPSGNLSSSLGSKKDELVHWCHGGSGHILLLVKAYEVFGREEYILHAETIAQYVVWPRGLLRKGVGLCHGISGNAYALLAVHHGKALQQSRKTCYVQSPVNAMDGIWLKRAILFGSFALEKLPELENAPDRPYSLYEGLVGLCSLLLDLSDLNRICSHGFPLFEI